MLKPLIWTCTLNDKQKSFGCASNRYKKKKNTHTHTHTYTQTQSHKHTRKMKMTNTYFFGKRTIQKKQQLLTIFHIKSWGFFLNPPKKNPNFWGQKLWVFVKSLGFLDQKLGFFLNPRGDTDFWLEVLRIKLNYKSEKRKDFWCQNPLKNLEFSPFGYTRSVIQHGFQKKRLNRSVLVSLFPSSTFPLPSI